MRTARTAMTDVSLQGWPVLETTITTALYLRIPRELQRPIAGGCCCNYCQQHPELLVPAWDTLGIPVDGGTTWTVHAPEWQPRRTDR